MNNCGFTFGFKHHVSDLSRTAEKCKFANIYYSKHNTYEKPHRGPIHFLKRWLIIYSRDMIIIADKYITGHTVTLNNEQTLQTKPIEQQETVVQPASNHCKI